VFAPGIRFVRQRALGISRLWRELLFLSWFQGDAFLLRFAKEFKSVLVGAFSLGDESGGLL